MRVKGEVKKVSEDESSFFISLEDYDLSVYKSRFPHFSAKVGDQIEVAGERMSDSIPAGYAPPSTERLFEVEAIKGYQQFGTTKQVRRT